MMQPIITLRHAVDQLTTRDRRDETSTALNHVQLDARDKLPDTPYRVRNRVNVRSLKRTI
jgi:hypothetical protein